MDAGLLTYYLALAPTLLVAITCHECAHAFVALKCGDPTAYQQGRVSLNPLVHLDPIGTFGILFVGFGWGKPVPVNRNLLRSPRADLLVSAAGPGTNFLLAALTGILLRLPFLLQGLEALGAAQGALLLAVVFVQINLALAFFNMIPLFPLDGAHVLENLLPSRSALRFQRFNRSYGPIVLIGLIAMSYFTHVSILSSLLGPPIRFFRLLFLGF